MYAFMRKPKWIIGTIVAVLVAAACVRLGIWQLHRLQEKKAYNATLTSRMAMPAITIADLEHPPGGNPDNLLYRRLNVVGSFLPNDVILFGRALDEEPGNHVLDVFMSKVGLAGGCGIVVDRGWVPYAMDTPPIKEAAPPLSTDVDVSGIWFPSIHSDHTSLTGGKVTTVSDVDVPAILPDGDAETSGCRDGYLWLQNQGPPQASGLPKIVPLPELAEGPHLSYAIQWFSFACVALIGWGVLIRKETRAQKPAASGTEDADPG